MRWRQGGEKNVRLFGRETAVHRGVLARGVGVVTSSLLLLVRLAVAFLVVNLAFGRKSRRSALCTLGAGGTFAAVAAASPPASSARRTATLVAANGILCHGFGFVEWDVLCNVLLLLVSRPSSRPSSRPGLVAAAPAWFSDAFSISHDVETAKALCFSGIWLRNYLRSEEERSDAFHFLLVQIPAALEFYASTRRRQSARRGEE